MTDALDLFAGHGWGVACKRLGINETGVEWEKYVVDTRLAAGMKTVHADVTELDPAEWIGVDGLIASPPCQDFSVGGKRLGLNGARGQLIFECMRYARVIQPKWIAFEQVPQAQHIFERFAEELRGMGYSAAVQILAAETLGAATIRKRVILTAHRDHGHNHEIAPTHSRFYRRHPEQVDEGVAKWRSVRDVLNIPADATTWGTKRSAGSPHVRAGDTRSVDIPSQAISRFASSWYVRTASDPIGRVITTNELGLIQSYPDGFPFQGPFTSRVLQVANSVAPIMAERVLSSLV